MKSFLTVKDGQYPMIASAVGLAKNIDPATPTPLLERVINGIVSLPQQGKMQGATANDFRDFFAHKQNVTAIGEFLGKLQPDAYPEKSRKVVEALRNGSSGIARILQDSKGADFIGKLLEDPKKMILAANGIGADHENKLKDMGLEAKNKQASQSWGEWAHSGYKWALNKSVDLAEKAGVFNKEQHGIQVFLDTAPDIVKQNRESFKQLLEAVYESEKGKPLTLAQAEPNFAQQVAAATAQAQNAGVSAAKTADSTDIQRLPQAQQQTINAPVLAG